MSSTATSSNNKQNADMSDGIIRIQADGKYDFDESKLTFREPKVMTSGAKLVGLAYGDGKASGQLHIETPTLKAPMGKMEWEAAGSPAKVSMMLSLNDMDTRSDVRAFQQLLETIDRMARAAGFERSQSWFRKTYKSADVVSDMYTALERKSRNKETGEEDGRWPPSVKMALPYGPDGKPRFVTYNTAQEEINLDSIDTRQANVTAIVSLQNIWIAGNMFGISLKAVQLLMEPKRTMAPCAFRNFSNRASLLAGPSAGGTAGPGAGPDLVESSDDEADIGAGDE